MPRTVVLALAATLLAAGSSCAKAGDEQTLRTGLVTVAALRAAPDLVAESGSGRFEVRVAVEAPAGVFDIVATGGFAAGRMHMRIDLGSVLAQAAEASGDTVPSGFDEPMDVVTDGAHLYVRLPMLESLTATAGWLDVPVDALAAATGSPGLGAAAASDPSRLVDALRGVAREVDTIGRAEVRGVATTHVRATIDLDDALQRASSTQRAVLADQLRSLDVAGRVLPVEVWIDGDGLPRRLTMAVGGAATGVASPAEATMTIDFFDYGAPVTVDLPDASEVSSLGNLLGALGGVR